MLSYTRAQYTTVEEINDEDVISKDENKPTADDPAIRCKNIEAMSCYMTVYSESPQTFS